MGKFIDLTGQRIGRLTVLQQAGKDKNGLLLWKCQCDCGNIFVTRGQDIRRGKSTNCGCRHKEVLQKRNYRHGMAGTRPYRIWKAMHSRCYNPKVPSYADYGGRGIKICDRWKNSFENFWADMHDGYADDLEIDRIDHDADYCPENCRWASDKQQNRNKRNNHFCDTVFGRLTMADLSDISGLSYSAVKSRVKNGWSGNDILAGRRLSDKR